MTDLGSASSATASWCGSSSTSSATASPRNSSEDLLATVGSSNQSESLDMMSLIPNLWSDNKAKMRPSHQGLSNAKNISRIPTLTSPWCSSITSPLRVSSNTPSISASVCSHPTSSVQEQASLEFSFTPSVLVQSEMNSQKFQSPISSTASKSIIPSQIAASTDTSFISSVPLTEENLSLLGQQKDLVLNEDSTSIFDSSMSIHSHQDHSRNGRSKGHKLAGFQDIGNSKTNNHFSKKRDNMLYKTEMCVQFQKHGFCPYGSKCQFAHGEQELKRIRRCDNWKTKPCVNWMRTGTCRYGKRCCFKHGDEDNGTQLVNEPPPETVMKKISMKLSQKGYYDSPN
ncbi:hypothetical protein FOA43_000709 [Brettanomyces nanus]|uniref:C3H1-type domain-containing protein n=1 Tax=Eeniella nana TaxID=13502 RepID=A0A875S0J6_EENNA|nr:uncharacterized protein FOA43_000709 [Brettanomyces nanus]QPG73399.1 hypothetical protein FOA43_000709 [Brettanomyces nanus]